VKDRLDGKANGWAMDQDIPKLLTLGQLAARLSVSKRRVQHLLRTRPHIRPAALAGRTRVFSHLTLAQLRYEINVQDAYDVLARADRSGRVPAQTQPTNRSAPAGDPPMRLPERGEVIH
jgi:hypothetical protein